MHRSRLRRQGLAARLSIVVMGLLAVAVAPAHAQMYPDRPVRFIVPFAAGGGVDNVARAIGPAMAERLRQPVVVDNRPGASANIGSEVVAKAAPDGHTLLIGATFLAFNRATMKGLTYDSAKDLLPVGRIVRAPFVLVVAADSPANSVADLVNWMKGHPGESSYGAVGSGSPTHLIFARRTDTSAVQVLYKGGAAAMPDLMSGRLTYMIQPAGEVIPHIASGRLKALAVTGLERSVYLPAVPTFAEAGVPDLVLTGWWGIFAPAGTPQPIINRLSSDLGAVLERDDVRQAFAKLGLEVASQNTATFADFYRNELAEYASTAERFNLKAE